MAITKEDINHQVKALLLSPDAEGQGNGLRFMRRVDGEVVIEVPEDLDMNQRFFHMSMEDAVAIALFILEGE